MSTLPPCPQFSSELAYENGEMYVCPECAHEWGAMQLKSEFVKKAWAAPSSYPFP